MKIIHKLSHDEETGKADQYNWEAMKENTHMNIPFYQHKFVAIFRGIGKHSKKECDFYRWDLDGKYDSKRCISRDMAESEVLRVVKNRNGISCFSLDEITTCTIELWQEQKL